MQENVIYLKGVDDYNEIIRWKIKLPQIIKRFIFLYKNIFHIITKKNSDGLNIWIIPYKEKKLESKFKRIINKQLYKEELIRNSTIVLSNNMMLKNITDILEEKQLRYCKGNMFKKILVFDIIKHINELQKKQFNQREITILVEENNELNNYIIKKIAMQSRTIKIVSKKIYKFKTLEENLYNEYGIPIQFSNSYQKSLSKSDIIINLDFDNIEINEYNINSNAIIINTKDIIKIKTKSFNGIVVNSVRIKFSKELNEIFNRNFLLDKYDNMILYESIIDWKDKNYNKIEEKKENDKVKILNLIGNNGIISKREIKIVN